MLRVVRKYKGENYQEEYYQDENYRTGNFIISGKVIVAFLVLLLLMCLLNTASIPLYLAGVLFLFLGIMANLSGSGEKMTLIFLFSHGITGYLMMVLPTITSTFDNPLFSDSPINLYVYLGFTLLLFIIAQALIVIVKIKGSKVNVKKFVHYALSFYVLSILLSSIFPLIINEIYNFSIF